MNSATRDNEASSCIIDAVRPYSQHTECVHLSKRLIAPITL